MLIAEIMSDKGQNVITVDPNSALNTICSTLTEHKIGAVVVSNGKGGVAGILSERDIVRAICKKGASVLEAPTSSYMTADVVTCTRKDTVLSVMERMTAGRFRHMPVLEGDQLVGVVSIGDIVKARIAIAERDAEEMRSYILAG